MPSAYVVCSERRGGCGGDDSQNRLFSFRVNDEGNWVCDSDDGGKGQRLEGVFAGKRSAQNVDGGLVEQVCGRKSEYLCELLVDLSKGERWRVVD